MSPWNHRQVVYVRPEPRPETVPDLYARLLEAPPRSELAHARAYILGMHTDKPQAMAFGKMMANDPDPAMRWAGIVVLSQLHKDGLREAERGLLRLAEDPDWTIRAAVAHELHYQSSEESARILQSLATDPVPQVRKEAAGGLYWCEDPTSRQALLVLARDPEDLVRSAATNSLGWIDGGPIDIIPLMDLFDDPCPDVRGNMVDWLGWVDKEFAFPHLLRMSRDPDSDVRYRAIKVMGDFEGREVEARLVEATSDPSAWVRAAALKNLGGSQSPGITEIMVEHALDESSQVRKVVAQCLETRATVEMLPIFEKLGEDDSNALIRRSTVRCLEGIPGEEAERILVSLMHDSSPIVSKTAKKVLEKRAKADVVDPGTAFELRFGRGEAVATRIAFHGRSSVPLKAWQKFLDGVQRHDGLSAGDSEGTPAIQVETPHGWHFCILPFGPAHWMRIEYGQNAKGGPMMGYSILTTSEVDTWSQNVEVQRVHTGRALSKRLGWFQSRQG